MNYKADHTTNNNKNNGETVSIKPEYKISLNIKSLQEW